MCSCYERPRLSEQEISQQYAAYQRRRHLFEQPYAAGSQECWGDDICLYTRSNEVDAIWQRGANVYQVISHDQMTALQVAVAMKFQ